MVLPWSLIHPSLYKVQMYIVLLIGRTHKVYIMRPMQDGLYRLG